MMIRYFKLTSLLFRFHAPSSTVAGAEGYSPNLTRKPEHVLKWGALNKLANFYSSFFQLSLMPLIEYESSLKNEGDIDPSPPASACPPHKAPNLSEKLRKILLLCRNF